MFGKKEYAVEVIDNVAINLGEKKVDYEARVKRLKEGRAAEEQRKIEIEQFNNLKSLCLSCKNAFFQQYIDNPQNPDPLDLVCKKIGKLSQGQYFFGNYRRAECWGNKWHRKVLNCSDYEKR